jgi:hypothetical protein
MMVDHLAVAEAIVAGLDIDQLNIDQLKFENENF